MNQSARILLARANRGEGGGGLEQCLFWLLEAGRRKHLSSACFGCWIWLANVQGPHAQAVSPSKP